MEVAPAVDWVVLLNVVHEVEDRRGGTLPVGRTAVLAGVPMLGLLEVALGVWPLGFRWVAQEALEQNEAPRR